MSVFWVALFGACGALLRYGLVFGVHEVLPRDFPYGTWVVNVVGCLLIGLLHVFLVERVQLDPSLRIGLLVGLLGAFTTFSTFSMETVQLFEAGEFVKGLFYVALSVVCCLLATWAGVSSGRIFFVTAY